MGNQGKKIYMEKKKKKMYMERKKKKEYIWKGKRKRNIYGKEIHKSTVAPNIIVRNLSTLPGLSTTKTLIRDFFNVIPLL